MYAGLLSVNVSLVETGNLMVDAQTAFARSQWSRRRARLAGWILRRPRESTQLASLEQALGALPPGRRTNAGLRAVPLGSIVGTAESVKARRFDRLFRPPASSRRRWEGLWQAARRGAPLPPISVYRVGEDHYVDDGHHRVSVAHALGMAAIDAEVTELGVALG
jgi:hypothetical protein